MGTTAQKLQKIIDSKTAIKTAIEEKGQIVGDIPLSGYADKIRAISGGSIDMQTFWNVLGDDICFGGSLFSIIPEAIMDYLNIYRKVDNINNMFYNCKNLTRLPPITKQYSVLDQMCHSSLNLEVVEYIDLSKARSVSAMLGNKYAKSNKLTNVTLDNMGMADVLREIDFSGVPNITKESLWDCIYTRSFDRASSGYDPMNIILDAASKALMTTEEVSMVEAKGYVIS